MDGIFQAVVNTNVVVIAQALVGDAVMLFEVALPFGSVVEINPNNLGNPAIEVLTKLYLEDMELPAFVILETEYLDILSN